MGLIDSHAHLTDPELAAQLDDVLRRCDESDVEHVITIGTDLEDAKKAIGLRDRHPDRISAAAGFHPHGAATVTPDQMDAMTSLWQRSNLVAVGEVGLDYHYDLADHDVQQNVLDRQLAASSPIDLPLIIHCREAMDDTVALLLKHGYKNRRVVFHCFTGTTAEAELIACHGWRISFTGIVTFRKSKWLQEIAAAYPAEALMVETDAPYLTPEPHRGRYPNEPANVRLTAEFLANLRGIDPDEMVRLTSNNTRDFFDVP